MNKRDLVRIIIDWLAGVGAMIVTILFTDKIADPMVDAIPYEDRKANLKVWGIGAIQGTIIGMVTIATTNVVDKLIRKIQNK